MEKETAVSMIMAAIKEGLRDRGCTDIDVAMPPSVPRGTYGFIVDVNFKDAPHGQYHMFRMQISSH